MGVTFAIASLRTTPRVFRLRAYSVGICAEYPLPSQLEPHINQCQLICRAGRTRVLYFSSSPPTECHENIPTSHTLDPNESTPTSIPGTNARLGNSFSAIDPNRLDNDKDRLFEPEVTHLAHAAYAPNDSLFQRLPYPHGLHPIKT